MRCAAWPARYPLAWVDARKREFDAAGLSHAFAQEYLCQPEDEASKVFTASMLRIEPTRAHVGGDLCVHRPGADDACVVVNDRLGGLELGRQPVDRLGWGSGAVGP